MGRDMKKAKYKGLKYDEAEEARKRAAKKAEMERKKKEEALREKEKLLTSPREARKSGKGGWKPLKYDEAEQERQRAAKKAEKERKKKEAAASDLKKAGPRDMGKMKYKGTKLDYQDDGDMLADRTTPFTKRKSREVGPAPPKKLGPRDMGK